MTTRRAFLAASAGAAFAAPAGRRSNVLFLAADDLNTGLGCYGHPVVKSPNIDRLAARGVRFDRAYCQYPLCGPSRASLLTGLRPDSTQVLGNNIDFRDFHPRAVTLPQLFKNNGWFAAREGKMFHMNVPDEVGTPRFQDEPSWNHSVSPPGLEHRTPGEGRRLNPPGVSFGMQWISAAGADGQADTAAADHALSLLEKHKADPFFLAVGFLRPHLPFVAPSRFYDLYPPASLRVAKNPPGDLDDIPAASKAVRPHLWNDMRMDEPRIREALRGYYASTSYMDDQVGRVPLIVAAPGRRGNGRGSNALVEFVDVYPTLAALCGLQPPGALEGQSIERLLDDPARAFKKAAFTQLKYQHIVGRSVRTARWRYIRWEGEGGGEELYNHEKDPREFTNLAARPAAGAALDEHRRILGAGWRAARAAI